MPVNRTLFCFDFDNTIVDGHFHNALNEMNIAPGSASIEQINALLEKHDILNQSELLKTFKMILKKGHYLAITTWSEYPEVIAPTLKKLGLTETEIAKIHIESGLPASSNHFKSKHIERAKKHFGVTDNSQVWLIDNDEQNIAQARKEGQINIAVRNPHTSTSYLDIIHIFLNQRRVKFASLNSLEGGRLFDLRNQLRADGKRPAGPRKDGEKPLARFLAKNPLVLPTEKPKENEGTKEELTASDFRKCLFIGILVGLSIAATELYALSMLMVALSASSGLLAYSLTHYFLSSKQKANQLRAKDPKKWLEDNKTAYALGAASKNWIPYLKSYGKLEAYSSAYRLGLDDALKEEASKRHSLKP